MDVFENGEKIQTRELVLKTKKLAVTIHRCNLQKCDTVEQRVLCVDTSPEYYIVVQGVIASEGRRLKICQSEWESDGGTLKPLTRHSSLSTNMLSMCKCGNVQCPCRKCVVMCVIYCHKSQVRNCQNRC